MPTKYPKRKGNCEICGRVAMLYQQPKKNGFRGWCKGCNKLHTFIRQNRRNAAMPSTALLQGIMAIMRGESSPALAGSGEE
jgi:hypothetical protein